MARLRIGVDMDNTLCIGKHWDTPEECMKAEPIPNMIEYVNRLYKDDFIVIYTARQNFLMSVTFDWLDKHGVRYHAVANRKVPFDRLIDDTAHFPKV
jgi:uncharacterized HAD superfamily protein